ncbi:MAG: tRNA dihydrouridine(20/20a) synthase DusA [Geminicoccaceae bacterium]|nr:tRNA dihydrouridine(20/20a) synthase DusA [Geminicoccaceae bacterium]MCS7269249.1 tRNA dihydrouridine(20/20a) synthase DusA [Geminicoccaceae bacterium]MDW8125311.1 tRNA dihydrouridine(20/20a) synthase DusA [Geminicoccaceae bacterium]MDW8342446.1 tRNA dihydrouridine(20/20a) synthase DusA [Geminicoccaceae bacterium]
MTECAHRLCVAPMMDWTDRHCRFFLRLLAPRTRLYTEMVPATALLRGDPRRFLAFDPAERPLALQLGGSDPEELARAAALAEAAGFDEVDLNCGCPSDRVRRGRFGACLMAEPALVAECVAAMRAAVRVPVTVKCRIGIDDQPVPEALFAFLEAIRAAGCRIVIVHARKAWLAGLSPAENRTVPPLEYGVVRMAKEAFPDLTIVLNGGIRDPEAVRAALAWADGAMIGRQAYTDPWSLRAMEEAAFGTPPPPLDRARVLEAMAEYAEARAREGVPVRAIARHLLGLVHGLPGARAWRGRLVAAVHAPDAGPWVLRAAAAALAEGGPRAAAA